MEPWTILLLVVAVLLAVLVGAALPTLIQLRSTLRSVEQWTERVGPKLEGTLGEAQEVTRRLNRTGSELEQSTARARVLLDAAGDIGETLRRMNRSLQTAATLGSAVGPVIAAAVRAFVESEPAAAEAPANDPEPVESQPSAETTREISPQPAGKGAQP